jgi:hypothetical protein
MRVALRGEFAFSDELLDRRDVHRAVDLPE